MGSGIYKNDWMFSVKEKPWHGIGTVVSDAPTSEDAIRIAKLDWSVNQMPIYASDKEIPGYFANVRSDTNETLGIVQGRYKVQQNAESFAFVDDIINNSQGIKCKYETAGSLFNGKRTFLLVRLPETDVLGVKIENYLYFTNSHDGSTGLLAGISNVRVVCNNTLTLAIRNAQRSWTCRHTAIMDSRKEEAAHSLGLAIKYVGSISIEAEEMVSKKISRSNFIKLFQPALISSGASERSAETIVDRITEISAKKADLANFRNTAWGWYQATADLASNTKPLKMSKNYEINKLVDFFDGNKTLGLVQKVLQAA
jgi:phage/plasmid-like protein (TIGR03299 family)